MYKAFLFCRSFYSVNGTRVGVSIMNMYKLAQNHICNTKRTHFCLTHIHNLSGTYKTQSLFLSIVHSICPRHRFRSMVWRSSYGIAIRRWHLEDDHRAGMPKDRSIHCGHTFDGDRPMLVAHFAIERGVHVHGQLAVGQPKLIKQSSTVINRLFTLLILHHTHSVNRLHTKPTSSPTRSSFSA